jgi:hypothetical protein
VGRAPLRPAPEGLTHEEWWLVSKIARNGMERALPLTDTAGSRFSYALPDEVLKRGHAWTPADGLMDLLDPTPDAVGRHRRRTRRSPAV